MLKNFILIGLFSGAMLAGQVSEIAKESNRTFLTADTNIIVTLKGDPSYCSRETVLSLQNSLVNQIKTLSSSEVIINERYTNVINAMSLKVNAGVVAQIRNYASVRDVDYSKFHRISDRLDGAVSTTMSIPSLDKDAINHSANSMNVPKENNGGEGVTIAVLDTGFFLNGYYYDENDQIIDNATHEIYGDLGSEVNVAIEDAAAVHSLVDAAPGFHGKYDADHSTFFSRKVPFYYDYGGDLDNVTDYYNGVLPDPDYDVFAFGADHGNHVASIALGNAPHFKGIAPKAQLLAMKVFTVAYPTEEEAEQGYSMTEGAYDEPILNALEDAYALGADVVNMSLGSTLDDFDGESACEIAIQNLKKAGCFVCVAAGNDGRDSFDTSAYEFWSTEMVETGILSGHANNESSFVVAASQPDTVYYEKALKLGDYTIEYYDQITSNESTKYKKDRYLSDLVAQFPDKQIPWERVPGLGEEKDYADIDVEGKIAIIDRGETTFAQKTAIATAHGAVAAAIIDNDPTATTFNFRMDMGGYSPDIPVVSILFRDKEKINSVDTRMSKLILKEEAVNPMANKVSTFSSIGPSYDLQIKPDITAPGEGILGAILDTPTSYDYYDGTSMACPNTAGAVALVYGEHVGDKEWKSTVYQRIISTAKILTDGTNDPHFESVRRQGSGLINVGNALETDAYLTGSRKGQFTDFAKIELGNTADIAGGEINLKFKVHNEAENAVQYKATTHILRSELCEQDDEERFAGLTGVKMQATYDHVIDTVVNNITVDPGENEIALPSYTLHGEEKEILDKYFTNGTYIEGFVVLEAEGKTTLNIPFLGFYGDWSSQSPVEPFLMERDPNKVYQSEIAEHTVHNWAGKTTADFSSDIVMGYYKDLSKISMSNYLQCNSSLRDMADGTPKQVIGSGTNPYTGEFDTNTLYCNTANTSNTIIMTQWVNRSVVTNYVNFINKANGKTYLEDHMYDYVHGPVEDMQGKEIQWPLYKSQLYSTLWNAGYYLCRAYSLFPLYESTYNPVTEKYKVGERFPDGEYEIDMTYVLTDGSTFNRKLNLVIDNNAPRIASLEKLDNNILRIRYDVTTPMAYANVSGVKCQAHKDEKGYYVDINLNEIEGNKIWVNSSNYTIFSKYAVTHKDDKYGIVLQNTAFTKNIYDFTTEVKDVNSSESGKIAKEFNISVSQNSGKEVVVKDKYTIALNLYGFDPATVSIKTKAADGTLSPAEFKLNGTYASFDSATTSFVVEGVAKAEPTPEPKKGGCGSSLLATSGMIALIAAAGVFFIAKKKREE